MSDAGAQSEEDHAGIEEASEALQDGAVERQAPTGSSVFAGAFQGILRILTGELLVLLVGGLASLDAPRIGRGGQHQERKEEARDPGQIVSPAPSLANESFRMRGSVTILLHASLTYLAEDVERRHVGAHDVRQAVTEVNPPVDHSHGRPSQRLKQETRNKKQSHDPLSNRWR